jgi:hypothetical protein
VTAGLQGFVVVVVDVAPATAGSAVVGLKGIERTRTDTSSGSSARTGTRPSCGPANAVAVLVRLDIRVETIGLAHPLLEIPTRISRSCSTESSRIADASWRRASVRDLPMAEIAKPMMASRMSAPSTHQIQELPFTWCS